MRSRAVIWAFARFVWCVSLSPCLFLSLSVSNLFSSGWSGDHGDSWDILGIHGDILGNCGDILGTALTLMLIRPRSLFFFSFLLIRSDSCFTRSDEFCHLVRYFFCSVSFV